MNSEHFKSIISIKCIFYLKFRANIIYKYEIHAMLRHVFTKLECSFIQNDDAKLWLI